MLPCKFAECCDGATLHFKIDDDSACLRVCADANLVRIEVFAGKWGFTTGVVLGKLCRVQCCPCCQGRLARIPELQVSRLQNGPDLLFLRSEEHTSELQSRVAL